MYQIDNCRAWVKVAKVNGMLAEVLYSYKTPVAGVLYVGESRLPFITCDAFNFSRTTSSHISKYFYKEQFIEKCSAKMVKKAVKSGNIEVLNKIEVE